MPSRPLRVGVAGAKAQLSAIVRAAPTRRTIIQLRGKDAAVVIGIDELQRLEARSGGDTDGARVLARIAAWRDRTGGVEDFEAEAADIVAVDPLPRGRGKRRSASHGLLVDRNVASGARNRPRGSGLPAGAREH